MVHYKLTYFPVRGYGEVRYLPVSGIEPTTYRLLFNCVTPAPRSGDAPSVRVRWRRVRRRARDGRAVGGAQVE